MDIIKELLLPEPSVEELEWKDRQLSQYKEAVYEKNVVVRNHLAKIKELEYELAEVKLKQAKMEYTIKGPNMDENELTKVIISYDTVVKKLLGERKQLITEKEQLENHIINLEKNFKHLLGQYEKSREIINNILEKETQQSKQIEEFKQHIHELKQAQKSLVEVAQLNRVENHGEEKENIYLVDYSKGDFETPTPFANLNNNFGDICLAFESWKKSVTEF